MGCTVEYNTAMICGGVLHKVFYEESLRQNRVVKGFSLMIIVLLNSMNVVHRLHFFCHRHPEYEVSFGVLCSVCVT